jgi:hypothetical protein
MNTDFCRGRYGDFYEESRKVGNYWPANEKAGNLTSHELHELTRIF